MIYIACKRLRHRITICIATSIVLWTISSTNAALIISIPHVSVTPGGSGYLDVLVHSSTTDEFQNYFLQFSISGPSHPAEPLNFQPSALAAPQLFATNPDYVFLGDSAEASAPIGLDYVSNPAGNPNADDVINVVDLTASGWDREINAADGPFLLARLNFIAPLNATPGNIYDINMDVLESFFYFADINLSPQAIDPVNVNIGTIAIAPVAVPEPSTFAILATAGAGVVVRKLRRRNATLFEIAEPNAEG